MKKILNLAVTLFTTINVLGYHDPDLNYHINQIHNLQNCGGGYSYPAPAVQLTTSGVKTIGAHNVEQPLVPTYHYVNAANYGQHITYQTPKISYATEESPYYDRPPSNYASSSQAYSGQREFHGYATTAGLSSSSSGRTVTPLATYAQAPIIAKITAAPLRAKFALAPSKASYATQSLESHEGFSSTGSLAKASLSSQSVIQPGGTVVSQVFAAPSLGYATSPALKLQQSASTYSILQPVLSQYAQSNAIPVTKTAPAFNQYAAAGHFASSGGSSYYTYTNPGVNQYSSPVATQYTRHGLQYHAPAVLSYPKPVLSQYSTPAVFHYSAGGSVSSAQYNGAHSAGVGAVSTHSAAGPLAAHVYGSANKNVHTEFLENYDAHPRYAYEYGVHDPHTGDIKHQKEQRDGEVVKGQYSLVEPDGSVRTVDYIADWKTGFHANVHNSKDKH